MKHLLLFAIAMAAATPAFAVTPVSASMSLTATASYSYGAVSSSLTDTKAIASFTNPVEGLSVATGASVDYLNGAITASAAGSAFYTADYGVATFDRFGTYYTLNAPGTQGQIVSLNNHLAGPDWSYTFTADRNGTIALDYYVQAYAGYFAGVPGYAIGWSGPGGGEDITNLSVFDPSMQGTFTRNITRLQTYTISVDNQAFLFSTGHLGDNGYVGASMKSAFVYNISEVPEPASWAMMIMGFGLTGTAMRRRARVVPA